MRLREISLSIVKACAVIVEIAGVGCHGERTLGVANSSGLCRMTLSLQTSAQYLQVLNEWSLLILLGLTSTLKPLAFQGLESFIHQCGKREGCRVFKPWGCVWKRVDWIGFAGSSVSFLVQYCGSFVSRMRC